MELNLNLSKELVNFENKEKQYTIPIFIPHKGCPNSCVFCNQKKISGQTKDVTAEDVDNIIREYLEYYKQTDKKIEVAFFGGSFTGIDIQLQETYLKVAYKYIKSKDIDSIRLSTRPDYINDEILNLLSRYGVGTIELGVQSMDSDVLKVSKRGHSAQDVIYASNLIKKYNIRLGHQIMIGLPKSDIEKEIYTIKECLKLKPKQLRIYPVYVIEDSELYGMYEANRYTPLTIIDAVKRCIAVIRECQNEEVSIIRLGLQSTSEITANNSKIAGPVSDNLAEYVMAGIIREKIEEEILDKIKVDEKELIVHVLPKYVSTTIGPKKINKIYFENKYNIKYKVKGEI